MDLWKFLKQQCLSQSCCCCGVPVAPNLSGCIILTVGLGGWSVAAAFHSTNDCHRGEASCTIGMADWAGMQGVLHGIVLAVVLTVNPDEDHYDYLDRRNLVGHFLFAFWSFTCCACGWFGALGYNMRLLGLYFFYFTSTSGLLLYRMFSVYFHIPDMCTQWSDESRVLTDMSDDDAYHTDIDDCIDDCRSTMRWVIGLCALLLLHLLWPIGTFLYHVKLHGGKFDYDDLDSKEGSEDERKPLHEAKLLSDGSCQSP